MTDKERDRIECAIRHIQTAVDVDSWAAEIAVEAMRKLFGNSEQLNNTISRQAAVYGKDHIGDPGKMAEDLISRQAAIDAILHNQEVYSNNFGNDPIDKYTIAIIDNDAQTIAQLPSVQPDVVRCKDCKHSEFWYRDKRRCFLWHEEGIDVFEDGFCNYAERRTDE